MSKEIIVKSETERRIEVPSVPNFVRVNGNMTSLANLSYKELDEISKAWREALHARAAKQYDVAMKELGL